MTKLSSERLSKADLKFLLSLIRYESHGGDDSSGRPCKISTGFMDVLSTAPPRGKVNIVVPALSSTATFKEWNNADSIHSYSPAEFTSRITNIHHKQKTIVCEVLQNFREGTNVKKNGMTEIGS